MAAPTEKELGLIAEFRARIEDMSQNVSEYEFSDMYILRWIRAREYNLKKAEEMARKAKELLDSRIAIGWKAGSIVSPVEPRWFVSGFKEDNSPILIVPFGTWDMKRVIKEVGPEELHRYAYVSVQNILRLMEERSRFPDEVVTQFWAVIDFEGYSMRQLTSLSVLELGIKLLKEYEANCPETLKTVYVVNASSLFTALFAFVKPVLSKRTISKIQIHGKESRSWKRAILQDIPPHQLPTKYGGTLSSKSDFIYLVDSDRDQNGLNKKGKEKESAESFSSQIRVSAGKKVQIQSEVHAPNSILTWTFRVQEHDIGFRVLYEDEVETFSYMRLEAGQGSDEGSVLCERTGKYALEFDNSYSLLRPKILDYSLNLIPPQDIMIQNLNRPLKSSLPK